MTTVTQAVELLFARPGAPPFTTQRGDGWVVHVDQSPASAEAFAYSVARGLSDHPRWLHCRYLYDETGSELFTKITEQPEYYLTQAENQILEEQADEIRGAVGPLPLMELGAGTAVKTQQLLRAWLETDGGAEYLPLDIDPSVLIHAAQRLTTELPGLSVTGLATSYERGLDLLGKHQPLCLIFLGSSIGNFNLEQTDEFLARLRACLSPDDTFLLGVDLIKDVALLEAAYNDDARVSEAFTRNLFHRMKTESFGSRPARWCSPKSAASINCRRSRLTWRGSVSSSRERSPTVSNVSACFSPVASLPPVDHHLGHRLRLNSAQLAARRSGS
ncbi:MAG: L-histidine N(alpha)-methyltransferase [Gemmatimonadota bacterium]